MKTRNNQSRAWSLCARAIQATLSLAVGSSLSEPAFGQQGAVVRVDTVEELYAEFYNPNNVGATIELAPGTYVLNASGPNGGRLVFGSSTAAAISGQNEYVDYDRDGVSDPRDDNGDGEPDLDPTGAKVFANPTTETIITATSLTLSPANAFGLIEFRAQPNGSTSQAIRGISLVGNDTPRAAIIVQGTENGSLDVRITGCLIQNSPRGVQVDARAMNPSGQNARIYVTAEDNVIRNNGFPQPHFGWGIQLQQTNTSGVNMFAVVRRNRIYQNKVGLFVEVAGMQDGVTSVVSQSNIYAEAVLAIDPVLVHVLSAGIVFRISDSPNSVRGAARNQILLSSNNDAIINNEGWAGVYVEGVKRSRNGTEFINNTIDLNLVGTRFVKLNADGTFDGFQNREARVDPGKTLDEQPMLRRDIAIVGPNNSETNLREPAPGGFNGLASGNRVNLLLRNATSSLVPIFYDPAPKPISIVNNAPDQVKVTLIGSPSAFRRTNTGFNTPDESLFESKQ